MRNILVDRAREADAEKRGGGWQRVDLVEALQLPIPEQTNLGLLDEAIAELEQIDPRLARIVELRYFVGLSVVAIARVMDVDKRTIYRQWAFAKAWLRTNMQR
jgi:RNA polymerase sigma factor (TIGR02999 family)